MNGLLLPVYNFLITDGFYQQGPTASARLNNGFQSLYRAVKAAPEVWAAMIIRLAAKPEIHRFNIEIIGALVKHSNKELPEALFLCISKYLHKLEQEKYRSDDFEHR